MTDKDDVSERRRQVRDTILKTASMVYREHGPEGLSMRQLASRLDYAPATLYKYFRNKAELVVKVRDRFAERHIEHIREIMTSEDDPVQKLARGCAAYIEEALAEPELYTIAFGSRQDDVTPEQAKSGLGMESFRLLQDRLAQLSSAGLIAECDPERTAFCVWASLHGLANLLINHPEKSTADTSDLIKAHVGMVIAGLNYKHTGKDDPSVTCGP